MAEFLPVMLNTTQMSCLVVGGGKIALRKVLVLLRFGVKVTVTAEQLSPGLQKLVDRQLIRWRAKKFGPGALLFKKMVVAATNDPQVNLRVVRWARRFKLFYNTVDNLELSNFIFPAIYRSGPLAVAVSTQGYFPAAARKIKRELARNYGAAYGEYLEKLREYRQKVKTAEPEPERCRLILNHLLQVGAEAIIHWNEADFGAWLDHERKS